MAYPKNHDEPGDAYSVTADELRSFVERFEQLQSEKDEVAEQQKELMAEAKGRGYSTPIIREAIRRRKKGKDAVAEHDAILALYEDALLDL